MLLVNALVYVNCAAVPGKPLQADIEFQMIFSHLFPYRYGSK